MKAKTISRVRDFFLARQSAKSVRFLICPSWPRFRGSLSPPFRGSLVPVHVNGSSQDINRSNGPFACRSHCPGFPPEFPERPRIPVV